MLKCSFWHEIIILKKCLQSFSQHFCPFSLLFNPILTLQKTLPSVFVSYFFIFPLFPKNQDFSTRYNFISQRYSFISQRYFIISQRYFPYLIASLIPPRKNKEIPEKACGFENKVVTLRCRFKNRWL